MNSARSQQWAYLYVRVCLALAIEGMEVLLGEAAPQALADAMHSAWVGFITRGDPGWPQYDLDQRQTMHFDASSELLKDPRSAERALWEGLH